MAKLKFEGHASGTGIFTLTAPNSNTDRTITLPDGTGTLAFTTGDDDKLPLSGGTMTGNLVMGANLVDGIDISARDAILTSTTTTAGAALPKAGGTMTGNLVVNADIDMTGVLNGTSGSMDIKNEANGENIYIKTTSSNSEVTALKIHSGGTIELGAGQGLRVGGTAVANTLDDYEEGDWTPLVTCSTSGSYNLTGGANLGAYTKVGRVVHVQGYIGVVSESSPNGSLRMALPFTAFTGTDDTDYAFGNAVITHHGGNYPSNINFFVQAGAYAYLWGVNDDGTSFYVDHNDVDTNFNIGFNFSYIAA